MAHFIKSGFSALFVAIVSAVFAISFAAIIYKGELAPYLDRGIGLTLLGCTAIALIGAFTLSYRGSILAAQDVPAILLSGAAGTLVAVGGLEGEVLFATVVALTIVASLATGLSAIIIGHLKLAFIARFIPYPVLAGFLASTGLLLVIGGLGVGLGSSTTVESWAGYFERDTMMKWIPVMIAAILLVTVTRRFENDLTLPLALTATAMGFYVLIWGFGMNMDAARAEGFLLGPFSQGNLLSEVSPAMVASVDWQAIALQAPVIVTIVATCLLGTTLNASGLELALKRDFDINTEVKGVGLGNLASGLCGGIPGYHLVAESLLASRLGLVGSIAGISSAAGCALILVFGANILSGLPIGLFAAVLAFLGLDLLVSWVWEERSRLTTIDFAIVICIPVIAVTFSFLTAVGVGLLVACGFFIISYSKLNVIHSETDLSVRRSYVERPDYELGVLETVGRQVRIVELRGFLFFGSANTLRERIQTIVSAPDTDVRYLIVDFKSVTGIDVSTLRSLERMATDCATNAVSLRFSNLPDATQAELQKSLPPDLADFAPSRESALEAAEDTLIAAHKTAEDAQSQISLDTLIAEYEVDSLVERMVLEAGELLLKYGSTSTDIFYLHSGALSVQVPRDNGDVSVVAKIRAGSIIGEMAYYSGRVRSADICASTRSQLLRIDMAKMTAIGTQKPELALEFHRLIARHMARRLRRTTLLLRDLGM
ncbi:SulP family inorganic anion transporter [uncultured Sulfitobacter sp.]|uniref:SulP family inorganic anion transporter n=1 Tax=uncultured Sulfitobacter sp. TaxID=191468 RepID=UPI002601EF4E|nr:SulP family inorganic anion transporter [uncultured Sulfitobacter sp.]